MLRIHTIAFLLFFGASFPVLSQSEKTPKQPAPPKKESEKSPFSVTIAGDVDAKLATTAGQMTTVFYQSYPQLVARFENPKKPAPRFIRIIFEHGMSVPAYCTGSEIKVSVEWLQKHPDDIGMLTHELTHSVQGYPRGTPGWITEGLADYARQIYGPKEQPNWSLPSRLTERQSYRDSYRVTARFFLWLDAKYPGVIDKMHRRVQDRDFDVADFRMLTGRTIDDLWQDCVADIGTKKTTRR
jgi:hypothetical protein